MVVLAVPSEQQRRQHAAASVLDNNTAGVTVERLSVCGLGAANAFNACSWQFGIQQLHRIVGTRGTRGAGRWQLGSTAYPSTAASIVQRQLQAYTGLSKHCQLWQSVQCILLMPVCKRSSFCKSICM